MATTNTHSQFQPKKVPFGPVFSIDVIHSAPIRVAVCDTCGALVREDKMDSHTIQHTE